MQAFATKLHEQAKTAPALQAALDALLPALVPTTTNADKNAVVPALADASKPQVKNSAPFAVDSVPGPEFSPYSGVGAKIFAIAKPGELLPGPVGTSQGLAIVRLGRKSTKQRLKPSTKKVCFAHRADARRKGA